MSGATFVDPKRVKLVLAPTMIFMGLVGVWKAGVAFTEFRTELNENFAKLEFAVRDTRSELKREIATKTADRWTETQMREWSYQLERANRTPGSLLAVPSIPTVVPAPHPAD